MLKGLTNTFKQHCNNAELEYSEYVVLNGTQIPIKAQLKDDSYENGNFIGTFILKQISFETEATYDFKDKEFEYYKVVDNESIKMGTFMSTDITINDTTEIVKVIGMDYGLKTQIEYQSTLDYASGNITLLDVWNECCTLSGLESGIDIFTNSDFIVDSDQFSGTGATVRDVFKAIAMSSGTFVKVMNDDKIYLVFNELTSDIEEVEINGSATIQDGYKLEDLQLQGNTTQDGTPTPDSPQPISVVTGRQEVKVEGKNLCPAKTFESLSSVRLVSTATSGGATVYGIPVVSGQTYTASFDVTTLPSSDYRIQIINSSDSTQTQGGADPTNIIERQQITCNQLQRYSVSLTTTQVGYLYLRCVPTGFELDNIQIEKGTNTTYEEYKGQSYEINLGKNLLNLFLQRSQGFTRTLNGITETYNNDGSITYNGTATSITDLYITTDTYGSSKDNILLDSGKSYTLSLVGNTNNNIQIIIGYGNSAYNTSTTRTFTPTTNISWLFIRINNGTTLNNFTIYPQLEKGNATSYAPYKTPIELCKIGNYTDHIFKAVNGDSVYDNLSQETKDTLTYGSWYIEKQIGKVVLDGTQTIYAVNTSSTNTTRVSYDNIVDGTSNDTNIFCNRFTGKIIWSTDEEGIYVHNKVIAFRINKTTGGTTIESINSYLSNNNVILYYKLATPTYTEITDSELISQLEAVKLIEGLNNVSISSSDLSSPLKISYYNDDLDIVEDYTELEDKRDTHPWTCLRLGTTQIDGNNLDYIDEELVAQYGENWLILNDNPFAYNQEKRSQLIENIFNQIKEFGYSAFVSKTSFKPYLTSGDIIKFKNRDGEFVKSILLRYNHNNEVIQLEAPSETSATVNYVRPQDTTQMIKNIQIIVNQDTQEINSINQNINTLSLMVDSQGNDIDTLGTVLTQTTESITANVSAIQETLENGVDLVKTTSVSINNNGINVSTDLSKIATIISNNAFKIVPKGSTEPLAFFGYDEEQNISVAKMDNLTITTYLNTGAHRIEKYTEDGEERTGFFYIGG